VEELRAARGSGADLVEGDARPGAFGFFERLNPKNGRIGMELDRLYRTLHENAVDEWEAEEQFIRLAAALIEDESEVRREPLRLDFARAAVRDEVHRRLVKARDCMLSASHERLDLSTVAREACLSTYYFHRLFSNAFGRTPHQFLTEARVRRATTMLVKTDKPVWAVAQDSGFESPAHFCRLYKRATGLRPSEVRKTPQD
jgi:transcriptional regulator GlxA family with amidase domain